MKTYKVTLFDVFADNYREYETHAESREAVIKALESGRLVRIISIEEVSE